MNILISSGLGGLCPGRGGKGCGQYVNKWAWLCSSKTLFTKTDQVARRRGGGHSLPPLS